MSDELKPCPFCGSSYTVLRQDENGVWYVTCEFCDATIYTWTGNPEDAVEKWNRRVSDGTVIQNGKSNTVITNSGTLNFDFGDDK